MTPTFVFVGRASSTQDLPSEVGISLSTFVPVRCGGTPTPIRFGTV